jgi:hypothetical protein
VDVKDESGKGREGFTVRDGIGNRRGQNIFLRRRRTEMHICPIAFISYPILFLLRKRRCVLKPQFDNVVLSRRNGRSDVHAVRNMHVLAFQYLIAIEVDGDNSIKAFEY